MDIKRRLEIEKVIREALVDGLLAAGYSVGLDNGGDRLEVAYGVGPDHAAKLKGAMGATDDERLLAVGGDLGSCEWAWVLLVYGNTGWDVICDYTTSLNEVVDKLQPMIDKFEEEA